MKKISFSIFLVLIMLSSVLSAEDDLSIILKERIFNDEKIISINIWSTEYGDLICIYSRPGTYSWGSDSEEQNMQHFVIYKQSKGQVNAVYIEEIYDILLGIVQYNNNSLHVTVPGGSVYHEKIYNFDGVKVAVNFK